MIDDELGKKAIEGGKYVTIIGECKEDELIKLTITRQPTVFMRSGIPHKEYLYYGQFVTASIIHESEVPEDDGSYY